MSDITIPLVPFVTVTADLALSEPVTAALATVSASTVRSMTHIVRSAASAMSDISPHDVRGLDALLLALMMDADRRDEAAESED